jgi:hypothetical protein
LSTRPPRAESGDAVGRENARGRGVLGIGEIQPLRAHPFGSSNLLRARHTELAQSNFKSKNKIYQPPKRICPLRTAAVGKGLAVLQSGKVHVRGFLGYWNKPKDTELSTRCFALVTLAIRIPTAIATSWTA